MMVFVSGCNSFEEIFGNEYDKAEISEREITFDYAYNASENETFGKIVTNNADMFKHARKEVLSIQDQGYQGFFKEYNTYDIDVYSNEVLCQKEYYSASSTAQYSVKRTYTKEKDYFIQSGYLFNRRKEDGTTKFGFSGYDDAQSIRQASTVNKDYVNAILATFGASNMAFGKSGDSLYGFGNISYITNHDTVEGAYRINTYYCFIDLGSIYSPKLQNIETIYRVKTNYNEDEKILSEELKETYYLMEKYSFSYGDLDTYGDYDNLTKILNQYVVADVGFSVTKAGAVTGTVNPPVLKIEQNEDSIYALLNVVREKDTYFSLKMSVLLSQYSSSNVIKNVSMGEINTSLPEGYYMDSSGYLRCEGASLRADSLNIEIKSTYDYQLNSFETEFKVSIV